MTTAPSPEAVAAAKEYLQMLLTCPVALGPTTADRNAVETILAALAAHNSEVWALKAMNDTLSLDNIKHFEALRSAQSELTEARKVVKLAHELTRRMEFIHCSDHYMSVWQCYQNHGGDYTKGPTYERELNALNEALDAAMQREQKTTVPLCPACQSPLLHESFQLSGTWLKVIRAYCVNKRCPSESARDGAAGMTPDEAMRFLIQVVNQDLRWQKQTTPPEGPAPAPTSQ